VFVCVCAVCWCESEAESFKKVACDCRSVAWLRQIKTSGLQISNNVTNKANNVTNKANNATNKVNNATNKVNNATNKATKSHLPPALQANRTTVQ
jgi:hypothetical protein